MSASPLFHLEDVSVRFDGTPVLDRFSLAVAPGEKVVLRGRSGSGKSTVLRLLLGFLQPGSGSIRFRGETLVPAIAHAIRRTVAFVPQDIDFEEGTVEEVSERFFTARCWSERPRIEDMGVAWTTLALAEGIGTKRVADLSGGERQRVALALALAGGREIFLLDEPTASLDGDAKKAVADRFLDRESDETVVVVSHDEEWNRPESATVVTLEPVQ